MLTKTLLFLFCWLIIAAIISAVIGGLVWFYLQVSCKPWLLPVAVVLFVSFLVACGICFGESSDEFNKLK